MKSTHKTLLLFFITQFCKFYFFNYDNREIFKKDDKRFKVKRFCIFITI